MKEESIPLDLFYNKETSPELSKDIGVSSSTAFKLLSDYWLFVSTEPYAANAVAKALELAWKDKKIEFRDSMAVYKE